MREKQTLTTGEVAKYCGVNFRTVIRWIERGHLDAYKLPGRGDNRIPVESFISFLKKNNIPVPEELSPNSYTLLMLVTDESFASELAAFIRRAGWEPLITNDPLHFGYYLAKKQPAGVMVFTQEDMHSTQRILSNSNARPSLLLLLADTQEQTSETEGWSCLVWPKEQSALLQMLQNKE